MAIVDDKSQYCIPFLAQKLELHSAKHGGSPPPFLLGVNGIQGAGKTTLVSTLSSILRSEPYNFHVAVLSLDDFYLRHSDQERLALAHPDNPLLQHRGQPSTHDLRLLKETFHDLRDGKLTILPSFDKSLYSGAGDRTNASTWEEVNTSPLELINIIILEGWCVGFLPLLQEDVELKWQAARKSVSEGKGRGQLGTLALPHILVVNEALQGYEEVWAMFDAFVHIDAEQTEWVYDWRLEAEHKMREERGSGMTDEQVRKFVDGYYPAYELYTETLRLGIFHEKGRQLRLVVGRDRRVVKVQEL